jgi:hypothetical protein
MSKRKQIKPKMLLLIQLTRPRINSKKVLEMSKMVLGTVSGIFRKKTLKYIV